jgi:hypothetical protein
MSRIGPLHGELWLVNLSSSYSAESELMTVDLLAQLSSVILVFAFKFGALGSCS